MGYEIVAVGVSQSEAYQLVKSQYYSIPPNPNQPHIGFIFCIPVFVTNATMYCIGGTEG